MINICIEMPSGAVSIGYDRKDTEKATATFERVLAQVKSWPGFVCDLIMTEEMVETRREHVNVAA
jgi:hypothetical protein